MVGMRSVCGRLCGRLRGRYVVGCGRLRGRYMVGMLSVCGRLCGRYVVGCGRYVVGTCSVYPDPSVPYRTAGKAWMIPTQNRVASWKETEDQAVSPTFLKLDGKTQSSMCVSATQGQVYHWNPTRSIVVHSFLQFPFQLLPNSLETTRKLSILFQCPLFSVFKFSVSMTITSLNKNKNLSTAMRGGSSINSTYVRWRHRLRANHEVEACVGSGLFSFVQSFLYCALSFVFRSEMPHWCIAYGCTNSFRKSDNRSWHRLPLEDKELLNNWLVKIRRTNTPVNQYARICGDHFDGSCFVRCPGSTRINLKKGSVPTKFSFVEEKLPRKAPTDREALPPPQVKRWKRAWIRVQRCEYRHWKPHLRRKWRGNPQLDQVGDNSAIWVLLCQQLFPKITVSVLSIFVCPALPYPGFAEFALKALELSDEGFSVCFTRHTQVSSPFDGVGGRPTS